jgi:hypothetical protein
MGAESDISEDSHYVGLDFKKAARYIEYFLFTKLLDHTHRPGVKLGQQGCVTWVNTQVTEDTVRDYHLH